MSENGLDLSLFQMSSAGTHVDCSEESLNVEMRYSAISWFFVWFFGTTRMPEEIKFICLETGEVFERLTDKSLIQHYMLYCKK